MTQKYKCSFCKEIHEGNCNKRTKFDFTVDQELIQEIKKIPYVWKVFPVIQKDKTKMTYEVYLDKVKYNKNLEILNSENIKIIDSRGFKTVYD